MYWIICFAQNYLNHVFFFFCIWIKADTVDIFYLCMCLYLCIWSENIGLCIPRVSVTRELGGPCDDNRIENKIEYFKDYRIQMVKNNGAVTLRHMASHSNIFLDTNLSKTYDIKQRDIFICVMLWRLGNVSVQKI